MPRAKTKSNNYTGASKNLASDSTNAESGDRNCNVNESIEDIKIKTEPPALSEEKLSPSKFDLSQFKYEKKPHIKIEFEKESPSKGDGKGLWEPANWKEFLVNLRIMRANNDAPVDTMGCHMSMDRHASPETYRYQCLISLMLSSQTKDQVTFAAMERLRARGLTVDNVLSMSDDELGKLIYPVGFWKTKVQYIKKTTQTLKEQYKGDIPDSVEKLCKLRGVGPKMAHICMLVAWDKVTGIGVDTHVHRISNRIGWVKKPTSTPEDTRKALETWLPFELWKEVNHLLVGFGQTICLPISPMCHECLNRDICPSSGKGKKSPVKNVKQEIKPDVLNEEKTNVKKEDTSGDNLNKGDSIQDSEMKDVIEINNEKLGGKNKMDSKTSPRNKKVTAKKVLNDMKVKKSEIDSGVNIENLNVKTEHDRKKSPRKRKVTPTKKGKQENLLNDDNGDFEVQNENLVIESTTSKKVTPDKETKKLKTNHENVNTEAVPQDRHSKEENRNPETYEDPDFEVPTVESRNTLSQTDSRSQLGLDQIKVAEKTVKSKKTLALKRSPRIKVSNKTNPSGECDPVQNRTRGAKK